MLFQVQALLSYNFLFYLDEDNIVQRIFLFFTKKGKNNYKSMKHTGKFVPHKGASLTAKFEIQKKHKA